jgi:hypothetical protein
MLKRLLIFSVILAALCIPAGLVLASHRTPATVTQTTTYACRTAAGAPSTASTNIACTGQGARQVGALGAYSIVHVTDSNANPGSLVFARCAQGSVVVGGGASLSNALNDSAAITASRPSGVTGWAAAYAGRKHSLNVYAICAIAA